MAEERGEIQRGRGSADNPKNRFLTWSVVSDDEQRDPYATEPALPTTVSWDRSKSILSENNSPDIPFRWSVNPYRGCEHGCIYCYARPSHEQLGFSAGLDFESRIVAKENAASLLREALRRPSWRGEAISIAGVTDAWQPVEKELGITRSLLEVLAEARQATMLITKNRLILRDLDLLRDLAAHEALSVQISLTTLSSEVARKMEPRASSPRSRLEVVKTLAAAGIPVGVMLGPIIPGLTDAEIPQLLHEAKEAGASSAHWLLLRLPGAVEGLFIDWLERSFPDRAEKVLSRIRDLHGGALNDGRFRIRNRGEGDYARQLDQLFVVARRRLDLRERDFRPRESAFRRPRSDGPEQLELFSDPDERA